tara:strand:+ start:135 stop:833 length:699 start_codon:yes stop_codon:yes gene_type:complete
MAMPYCRGCGKSIESDWKACPYCQENVAITVRTDRNREINNLLELAVMKLNQNDISEFDRIFLKAKEIDVKAGLLQFQDDERVFHGLLNFVDLKITYLVKTYKQINQLFGPEINKFVIEIEGNAALSTINKADIFKHHDPPLYNALYSALLTAMSKFDLIWDKNTLKARAEIHRILAIGHIDNDEMNDYRKAKIVLKRSLRMKKELDNISDSTMFKIVMIFILLAIMLFVLI